MRGYESHGIAAGKQSVLSAFPRKAWERAKSVFVGWVEARRQHNECRVLRLNPPCGLQYNYHLT